MGHATRTLLALAGLLMLTPQAAQATEYPYCLTFIESWAGTIERCEYSTMAQCQASAQGLSGSCTTNWRLGWSRSQNPDAVEPAARQKRIRY
jgi:hypothetical protein